MEQFIPYLHQLAQALLKMALYDLDVLTTDWVYWCVVPFLLYGCFSMMKWLCIVVIITAPFTIPVSVTGAMIARILHELLAPIGRKK